MKNTDPEGRGYLEKVQQEHQRRLDSQCVLWEGSKDAYGHPLCSIKGRVHRVCYLAFEKRFGYKPSRLQHTCGNKLCINPDHLLDRRKAKQQAENKERLAELQGRIDYLSIAIENVGAEGEERAKTEFEGELSKLLKEKEELIR